MTQATNKLEFYKVSHIEKEHIIVRDNDALMERVYIIGQFY